MMHVDSIEACLQQAAEQSSAWALIRETDAMAWVLVLSDESLVDITFNEAGDHLVLRGELGMVNDPTQRHAINELILRCTGVLPMPMICLGQDQRYETLTHWRIDLQDTQGLAALIEEVTEQIKLWREVVARPTTSQPTRMPAASDEIHTPAFGAFA